jgi:hypothetical protein
MNFFHKIASLLLLPLMLLSFSGASLRVHICNHTGAVYTDVYFAEIPHDLHTKDCCHPRDHGYHCCGSSCKMPGEEHKETCCVDLQKKIETDENYISSSTTIKIVPTALDIAGIMPSGISGYEKSAEICPPNFKTAWLPPPFQSRTVLIL